MKLFLKRIFIFLVCYEVFFFFYPTSYERLYDKYYRPLSIETDTMNFQKNPWKKVGFEAYLKSDFVGAQSNLKKAFKLEPNNEAIILGIGICEMEKGDFENAATYFREYSPYKKKVSDVKIWYSILCNWRLLRYLSGRTRRRIYSDDVYWPLLELKDSKGKYQSIGEDFYYGRKHVDLHDVILDFFDKNTVREKVIGFRMERNFVKNGFRQLEGIEQNSDFIRLKNFRDSVNK